MADREALWRSSPHTPAQRAEEKQLSESKSEWQTHQPQKDHEHLLHAQPFLLKTPQRREGQASFTDETGALAKTQAYTWQDWNVSSGQEWALHRDMAQPQEF